MARPRKNRLGEYAHLLGEELQRLLADELTQVVQEQHQAYRQEIDGLKREIRTLTQQVEILSKRAKAPKPKVGKWVPGGPGRPPKDAPERIAAYETRAQKTPKKR